MLLRLAGLGRCTRLPDPFPNDLKMFFCRCVSSLQPSLLRQPNQPTYGIAIQTRCPRYGPNRFSCCPSSNYLFDIHYPDLPVRHAQTTSSFVPAIPVDVPELGGWVNDPENVGE